MGPPETNDRDEILEYAAQLIEDASFTDIAGIWAKRKRDREDAELRRKTFAEARREMSAHIRAFKNRPELDAISVLQDMAELSPDCETHVMHLRDAWPLAWKGWLNIECVIKCNDRCIPPQTRYRISLTERGRAALASAIDSPEGIETAQQARREPPERDGASRDAITTLPPSPSLKGD